jgi:hypothetical protein
MIDQKLLTDPWDRFIAATARVFQMPLATRDKSNAWRLPRRSGNRILGYQPHLAAYCLNHSQLADAAQTTEPEAMHCKHGALGPCCATHRVCPACRSPPRRSGMVGR